MHAWRLFIMSTDVSIGGSCHGFVEIATDP